MARLSSLRASIVHLRQRQGFRRILSNSGWMMGEQVLRLLVGVGMSAWTARVLGPSQFGELSYAIAFATVFGIVTTLGLNRILVRELVAVAAQPDRVQGLMNTAFAMRLAAAAVVYALCLLAAWFSSERQFLLIALVAGGYFFSAADCVDLYFQARVQARTPARARLVSFAGVTLVRVVLLLADASLPAFAAVVLLEYAGAALALHWAYRHRGPGFGQTRPDWKLARQLLSESWPEVIAGFSGLLFMRMDQIMLQHLAGAEAVGTFAVAARLSEAWYFIPSAIIASTFPNIVASRAVNPAQYLQRLQLLMAGLCALAYAAVLSAMALGEPVIQLLYGSAYQASASILLVHIWCGLFVSLGLASGSWIMAERRVSLNLYRNLAGLGANLVLNLALIPRFGALGAAYATLMALVVAYMLFDAFVPSMKAVSRSKWKALLVLPALVRR